MLALSIAGTLGAFACSASAQQATKPDPRPDFSALSSVELFEELSQKIWQINVRVRTDFRKEVAISAVGGMAWNDDGEPYFVVAPAIALRGVWAGGSTADDIDVLLRHLGRIEQVDVKRLQSMIENESESSVKRLTLLCDQLRSVERELQDYGIAAEALPLEFKDHKCKPSSELNKEPPPGDRVQRIAYLEALRDELREEWNTHAANVKVLKELDRSAIALIDEATALLASVQRSKDGWIPFLEGYVGYAFQLSNQGVTRDLGGLVAGAGVGVDMPSGGYSIGFMLLTPFDPGFYLSWSASAFD